MKKIIGMIAAAATIATSVFAADVSAKVKVDGSLFNFNADGNKINALTIKHNSEDWNPDMSFSVSGDQAGASMKFWYGGDVVTPNVTCEDANCWNKGKDNGWCAHSKGSTLLSGEGNKFNTVAGAYSIWFKPFDMLKVTVGQYGTNLNQETIDWSHTESGIDTQGYALDLDVSGFFATVFFAPGWQKSWFTTAENVDATVNQLYAKLGYGADFGRVQGMFRLVDMNNVIAGAAYDNTFGSVKMFVNALVGIGTKTVKVGNEDVTPLFIRGEAFASTSFDALGISAFIAGGYGAKAVAGGLSGWRIAQPTAEKAVLGATLKLTYSLGSITPYIYIKDANFLAENFSMIIKPGVTGNLGAMSWEAAVEFTAQFLSRSTSNLIQSDL